MNPVSATYPGDPGDPATATAPTSDHAVHRTIRALRDLGVASPSRAASVLISAGGAGLTMEQRERVLTAFPPDGGWVSGGCT